MSIIRLQELSNLLSVVHVVRVELNSSELCLDAEAAFSSSYRLAGERLGEPRERRRGLRLRLRLRLFERDLPLLL